VIAVFIKPHGETAKAEFSSADRPGRDGAADWRRRPPAIRAADFDKQGQANPAFPLPPQTRREDQDFAVADAIR